MDTALFLFQNIELAPGESREGASGTKYLKCLENGWINRRHNLPICVYQGT